ncbi:hypothetical protein VPJ68_02280, partial [Parabacteroides distasonis]
LKGQVGDKVTVPEAPTVQDHHVDSITFNGTKVQAGSEVTLGETNELTYTYVKDEEPVVLEAKTTVNYQADGKAVSPQEKVELKGQVGDKVTVPKAPTVQGHHV